VSSVLAPARLEASPAGTATGPTVRSTARRFRGPALVLAALVLGRRGPRRADGDRPVRPPGPEVYAPDGARALAELLRDRDVEVTEAGTLDELEELDTPRTTVVVPFPEALTSSELRDVQALDGWVLVVGAQSDAVDSLGLEAEVASSAEVQVRRPACGLPAAQTAGTALLGGTTYRPTEAEGVTGCYASGGDATLLDLPAQGAVLVGDGSFLTNDALDDEGNAALALGLLAGASRWLPAARAGRAVPEGEARPCRPAARRLCRGRAGASSSCRARAVAGPPARPRRRGAAARRRARRRGRRGAQPALPRRRRPRPGRRAAARRHARPRRPPARAWGRRPRARRSSGASRSAPVATRPPSRRSCTVPPPDDDAALVRLADDLRSLESAADRPPAVP
jgi:hypothetical protein